MLAPVPKYLRPGNFLKRRVCCCVNLCHFSVGTYMLREPRHCMHMVVRDVRKGEEKNIPEVGSTVSSCFKSGEILL